MVYDPVTCDLYLLMTQNGNYYRLFSMDTKTYALSEVGTVGETVYDDDAWANIGDSFAGLLVNAEHIHAWTEWVIVTEPTDDTVGVKERECLLCGGMDTEKIPATGTEPTDPEVTEPETTEPEVTDPEATEPEETQKPTKPGTGDNATTGDGFMSSLWITLLLIGMAGVTVLLTLRKRFTV